MLEVRGIPLRLDLLKWALTAVMVHRKEVEVGWTPLPEKGTITSTSGVDVVADKGQGCEFFRICCRMKSDWVNVGTSGKLCDVDVPNKGAEPICDAYPSVEFVSYTVRVAVCTPVFVIGF